MNSVILTALVVLVVLFIVYQYDNSLLGLLGHRDGFENMMQPMPSMPPMNTANDRTNTPVGPGAVNGAKNAAQNMGAGMVSQANPNQMPIATQEQFADLSTYEGPANFGTAEAPAGCYPRDQLTPSELLPKDMNSIWAQQNPMGTGSLKGKNFLSAGALIGVNTVGQSLRNANKQLRSEPPNPQVPVSIFNQSTISPDVSHRPLEIGA